MRALPIRVMVRDAIAFVSACCEEKGRLHTVHLLAYYALVLEAERSSLLFVCLCEEPSVAVCVIAVFAVCVAALVFGVYIVVCTTLACMIVCLKPNLLLLPVFVAVRVSPCVRCSCRSS